MRARILKRAQATAGDVLALDRQHLQSGLAEISLKNKAVVASAEDDAVVSGAHC
jgi:hypothetical protein